jgi:hypothetical protein
MVQTSENSGEKDQLKTIIGSIGSFIFTTALIFFLFSTYGVNSFASAIPGLLSGVFVVFIVMGMNGTQTVFHQKCFNGTDFSLEREDS